MSLCPLILEMLYWIDMFELAKVLCSVTAIFSAAPQARQTGFHFSQYRRYFSPRNLQLSSF